MIIKSLEIYGYGQFVQRKIEFNKNFTEIFGENEAGKINVFKHSSIRNHLVFQLKSLKSQD